jgi:hypothetical protein
LAEESARVLEKEDSPDLMALAAREGALKILLHWVSQTVVVVVVALDGKGS